MIIAAVISILLMIFQASPQTGYPEAVEAVPDNCELTLAVIHAVSKQASSVNKPVILIARPGDGETAGRLHFQRLETMQMIMESLGGIKDFVKAEGERVKGQGRVECYIDGKLALTVLAECNERLIVGCEVTDETFVRFRKKKARRAKCQSGRTRSKHSGQPLL
ncbi:MAG TPA: hypothetical protein VFD58_21510 [Blastocatellia bacterium]|nr:hypothetical protein [Blastocatellia bacterium]